MVKKGSFLSRIAERLRSGSGVRVEEDQDTSLRGRTTSSRGDGGRGDAPLAAAARVERITPQVPSTGPAAEAKTTRKLNEREEAMVALGGHFQELAALLRGVHTRMDDKLGRLVESAQAMEQMPALANQQLDILRAVAGHVERQNQLGETIARSVSGLPEMMTKVDAALQRAAQSDERSAATMREFQSTMDRIHASMGRMVESSEQQARATQSIAQQRTESIAELTKGIEQAQRESVAELREAANTSLESLRRTHEDQSNRLQRVVQEHAGWNKAVLVVLGVVGLGMAALLVIQLLK